MSEDRKVFTDALHTLGTIIDDKQGRDAIHLAVEPIQAACRLAPGQGVGIVDGKATFRTNHLGIVDPFLKAPVEAGEWFWLVVYPRQITSLRHVWSHPDFPDAITAKATDRSYSEQWMRKWAMKHVADDYYGDGDDKKSESDAFDYAIQAGHTHNIGPYEDARDHIDNEWWTHWEAITGVKGERDTYFSCGC